MQILQTLLIGLFLCTLSSISAQSITEGSIKMEITDVESDNEAVAAQLEMMKGTETDYTFNGKKSLVTSNMMGGMIKMQSMTETATETSTMLFDMMGQKMMVESTKEDRAESEKQQKEAFKDMVVKYDEADTKEILGYSCMKAVVTGGEEAPFSFEMYVTKELDIDHKLIQGMQGLELDGFPLEYVMKMGSSPMMGGGMSMTYSATEIETTLDKDVFTLNTEGYKKLTFKEFEDQMKGLGGGMGF